MNDISKRIESAKTVDELVKLHVEYLEIEGVGRNRVEDIDREIRALDKERTDLMSKYGGFRFDIEGHIRDKIGGLVILRSQ